jgi:hypothetical protein
MHAGRNKKRAEERERPTNRQIEPQRNIMYAGKRKTDTRTNGNRSKHNERWKEKESVRDEHRFYCLKEKENITLWIVNV